MILDIVGRDRSVAVTGATGFLGSHLTQLLVELGANVVVLVRDDVPNSPISEQWNGKVASVDGTAEAQAIVERLLGDYEVRTVFHLAAQTQVGVANLNAVATYESNVAGTVPMIRNPSACHRCTAAALVSTTALNWIAR